MMKNFLVVVFLILIALVGSVYTLPQNSESKDVKMNRVDKKILIVYFSWSQNTKSIAEKIQKQVGGDLFFIEPDILYPSDYNKLAYGIAKEQKDKDIRPPLKNKINIKSYDIIFVGTPVWWHTMAPVIKTFLSENNFAEKTIIPFITHGGGGSYNITNEMLELAKGCKILSPLIVYEDGGNNIDKNILQWLNNLFSKK